MLAPKSCWIKCSDGFVQNHYMQHGVYDSQSHIGHAVTVSTITNIFSSICMQAPELLDVLFDLGVSAVNFLYICQLLAANFLHSCLNCRYVNPT